MIEALWLAIIITLVFLAAAFLFLGWRWESTLSRPRPRGYKPAVSIIIPAYKSEKTIAETIKSAKASSYRNKEIIVVNDSQDSTPKICSQLGVKIIQNRKRLGKAIALNRAVKKAKGEILFFLDSDTVMDRGCLSRLVPWFTKPDIGVVSPKYLAQKSKRILPRLAALENNFNSSFFKADMFFGSMISIRGCGVAVRRDFFEKVGGWSETIVEDVDFAGKTLRAGYRIHYEPSAIVRTKESETLKDLKSQRIRWGKGAAYSFLNYRSVYSKNTQFTLHFFPYIFLIFGVLGILAWQIYIFIPIVLLYALYSFSAANFATIMLLLLIPLLYGFFAAVATGSLSHLTIVTWREKESPGEIVLLIPYLFIYMPLVIFFYFRGMASGFSSRRFTKKELDLKDWKC